MCPLSEDYWLSTVQQESGARDPPALLKASHRPPVLVISVLFTTKAHFPDQDAASTPIFHRTCISAYLSLILNKPKAAL
jgi:hypothetical protein